MWYKQKEYKSWYCKASGFPHDLKKMFSSKCVTVISVLLLLKLLAAFEIIHHRILLISWHNTAAVDGQNWWWDATISWWYPVLYLIFPIDTKWQMSKNDTTPTRVFCWRKSSWLNLSKTEVFGKGRCSEKITGTLISPSSKAVCPNSSKCCESAFFHLLTS